MVTATFDAIDICEAHAVLEWHYNVGGWVRERKSNARRMEATAVQLSRIGFRSRPNLEWNTLTANGRAIYAQLVKRYGFEKLNANAVCDQCRELDKGNSA